jgi:hypothetical protein
MGSLNPKAHWSTIATSTFFKKCTCFIRHLPGLSKLALTCQKDHVHQHVENSVVINGKNVTRSVMAGTYPTDLGEALADIINLAQTIAHSAKLRRGRSQAL